MDIQGWLQGTADRAPPNPSDEVDAHAFGPPTPIIDAPTSKRYNRKRKRAASDSSIISLQQWAERRGKADDRSANATRVPPVDVSVAQSHSASRHRRPRSQEQGADGGVQARDHKAYERRARRKTKPDRYESKKEDVRERKKREVFGERRSKRKRTRTHRSGDGKRTESLIQGFKLKNRPSSSRLTLKPNSTVGLFKHGRASAQMAGRKKNGLPDLVFNELKFLRHSHEHQDERRPGSDDYRPSGQDEKRDFEREEISAYFNQRISRDHSHDHALSRRPKTKQKPRDHEHSHLPEGGSSPILPDEELKSIPYLGFGGKGAINQTENLQPSATTYLTWSESAAGSGNQMKRTNNLKPTREEGQPSTAKKAQQRRPEQDSTSRPPPGTPEPSLHKGAPDVPKGQWSKSRRIRGPANVEVYGQQSNVEPDPSTSKQKLHDSTSMSLPTRPPGASGRQRQQKPVVQQQVLPSDVGSFNTSDILKLKVRLEALAEEVPSTIQSVRSPQSDKENAQPISSSPTAKILRIAHAAMAKGYQEPTARPSRDAGQLYGHVDGGHDSHVSEYEAPRPNRHHLRDLDMNAFAYQPMHLHATVRGHSLHGQGQHDAEIVPAIGFDPEDDEMLDVYTAFEPAFAEYADATPDQVPGHVYAPPDTQPDLRSLSSRYDRPLTRARDVPWSQSGMSAIHRDSPSHAATADQILPNEEDHIGDRDFEDGLEGFWRPNRLY